jgi:hypothetical protein
MELYLSDISSRSYDTIVKRKADPWLHVNLMASVSSWICLRVETL